MSDRLTPETIDGLRESVLMDTEAARLLERAASLVERGWTFGVEAEGCGRALPPTHPDAARWCMRGAIVRAAQDLGCVVLVDTGDEYPELRDATPDAASVRARTYGAAAHAILGQAADPATDLPRMVSAWNDKTCLSGAQAGRKLRQGARHIRRRIADVTRGIAAAERPGGAS